MDIPVALGMRYGTMSIEKGLAELKSKGVDEVYVMPLYPHYAMSSYETVVVKVEVVAAEKFAGMKLDIMPPFTTIQIISKYWQKVFPSTTNRRILIIYYFPITEFRKDIFTKQIPQNHIVN